MGYLIMNGEKLLFFKEFFRDRNVASIMPSSFFSVKFISSKIDFSRDNIVVEYGPGSGAFTKYILKKMTNKSKLIVFETNKNFCSRLKKIDDDRLIVFNLRAERAKDILKENGIGKVNYIISGIPLSFLDENIRESIVKDSWDLLAKDGKFFVYQSSGLMKKLLEQKFGKTKLKIILLNIPPLFVFEVERK